MLDLFCELAKKFDNDTYIEIYNLSSECKNIFKSQKSEHLLKRNLMAEGVIDTIVEVENSNQDFTHKSENGDDELLLNKLTEWNLKHLHEFFKGEKITWSLLEKIKLEDIYIITQKMTIGDGLNFKYAFENWRSQNKILPLDPKKNNLSRLTSSPSPSNQSSYSSDEMTDECNVHAMHIIKNHQYGRKILTQYEKTSTITEENRIMLINIIIQYFDFNNIHMSLQTCHRLESEILEIFPTEKLESYRTDRRGKLYIKYHNNKKRVKSLDINKNDKPSTSGSKFEFVPENDALSCIQSLQYDDLPPENFKITWIGCSNFRINQIHNECENISKALQLWPQYKKPLGCQLIDLDFAVVQKNASHMVDFDEKMEKLLEYMKNHLAIYNKRSKQVLGSIEKHHFNEEKDECVLKLLWSLHGYLYPTKKFQRKGSDGKISHGRYSIKDSQESFIYVNENLQAIEEHVDFLIKRGEPIQPFIVAEENKDNFKINKFYVYLDGYFLPCTIFCRAMDLCFKSFHLFNAQYPQACLPFWTFIEKYLYNIENGNNNSKVTSLLSEISSV